MQSNNRLAYLDWLRILAILGVLVFHGAMAYVAEWDWHIKNKETSNLLMEFNFWLSRFRMPLLFFVSGTVTYMMIQKRTVASFIGLRFRRLFLPLLFGMFVIVPPQIYMERLTQGFKGSYLDFYKTVFQFKPYPEGNFSWHHLWFIFYLFLYDLLCAPLFRWSVSEKGKLFWQKLAWLAKGSRIYLLMLPSVILYTALDLQYPQTNDLIHDWGRLPYWLFFLLAGFTCICNHQLMESLERNRRTSFAGAFLTIIAINYLRWNSIEPWDTIPNWQSSWSTYSYLSLYAFTAWFWVMAAVGYGKKYLNKKHPALDYINSAVYPFYILHQTVMIVIVYYVVQTTDTILMKYLFTVLLTFIICVSIFHLFIRPYAITRFLFGMKPKKKVFIEHRPVAEKREFQTLETL